MNAMPQLHHRKAGPVGWGLLDKRVSVDLIADLHHVDAYGLKIVVASKTPTRVALISDAVAPTGLGDGVFAMWGEGIRVAAGKTSNASGGLAGSVVTLGDSVRDMVSIGFSLVDVVRMASTGAGACARPRLARSDRTGQGRRPRRVPRRHRADSDGRRRPDRSRYRPAIASRLVCDRNGCRSCARAHVDDDELHGRALRHHRADVRILRNELRRETVRAAA